MTHKTILINASSLFDSENEFYEYMDEYSSEFGFTSKDFKNSDLNNDQLTTLNDDLHELATYKAAIYAENH